MDSQRLVYMGWKHFDQTSSSYKSVRSPRGGGTREMMMDENTNHDELLNVMKKLFFPNNRSFRGMKACMDFKLGNFQGNIVSPENFTLLNYSKEYALGKLRVYLLTRKKRITEYTFGASDSDFEDEEIQQPSTHEIRRPSDNVTIPSPPLSHSFPSTNETTLPGRALHTITPEVIDLSKETHLIGTSDERKSLRAEIDRAYKESLAADQLKSRGGKLQSQSSPASTDSAQAIQLSSEEKSSLREQRTARVPSEPDLSEEHIVMSIQHPTQGIKRRIFRPEALMKSVYDWVGSLSENPPHFELVDSSTPNNDSSDSISPEDEAERYANITLKVREIDTVLAENADSLNSTTWEQVYVELQIAREKEREKLNQIPLKFVVDRETIFDDFINLYKKRNTVLHIIELTFKNESAAGDGITKDAFSTFFQSLYAYMEGYNEKV